MRAFPWVVSSAAACAVLIPVLAQQSPTIKVDVNLVHAIATVKTQEGQLVGDLSKGDFAVYDNGTRQEIAVFEHHTELPLSVALQIDTSGSTAKELKYESEASGRFARALFGEGNPNDVLSLYTFNWQVTQELRYTRSLRDIDVRLKGLRGEAGTALYDALVFGARGLEPREGRKAIVVVTDGGNTVSKYTIDDALEAAHLADAVIYSVVVVPITNDAGRNLGGERALETLAGGTGGRVFQPMGAAELDEAFTQILRDLRTQYLVAYYPRNLPVDAPRFHLVRVELSRKDLRAATRTGYYGDAPLRGKVAP